MKVFEEILTLRIPAKKSEGRSKGLHVSEILKDLAFCGAVLDEKWYSELKFEETDTNLIQMGFAFEDYIETYRLIPDVDFHPGELYIDVPFTCGQCGCSIVEHRNVVDHEYTVLRVFMSPDGWSLADPDDWTPEVIRFCANVLHELKFTYKSSRDFAQALRTGEKKSLMWLWQIKAYCKAMRTLAAKLHVMFARGNYSYNESDPDAKPMRSKTFKLLFTQQEIDDNWDMLVCHAQEMLKHGKFKPITK